MNTAWHLQVIGRVQGVGFRSSTRSQAIRWGVTGFVRNLPDGSVEILCEGSPEKIEKFLEWVNTGPPGSQVQEIRKRRIIPNGTYRRFSLEY